MADEYVTKEVYKADSRTADEKFNRVLEHFDDTVVLMRSDNAKFQAEVLKSNSEFRENISLMIMGIDKRVSNVENKITNLENKFDTLIHAVSIFGSLMALMSLAVALIGIFK